MIQNMSPSDQPIKLRIPTPKGPTITQQDVDKWNHPITTAEIENMIKQSQGPPQQIQTVGTVKAAEELAAKVDQLSSALPSEIERLRKLVSELNGRIGDFVSGHEFEKTLLELKNVREQAYYGKKESGEAKKELE